MSIDHPHSGGPSIRDHFKGRPVVALVNGLKRAHFERDMAQLSNQLQTLGSKIDTARSRLDKRPLI